LSARWLTTLARLLTGAAAGCLLLACSSPVLRPITPAPSGAPSATPSSEPGTGWRLLTDFPLNNAAQVNAIVASGSGFVAVGTAYDSETDCSADASHGRVWTSTDGVAWTRQPDDAFGQTDLTQLVAFNGALYALGFSGSLDDTTGCSQPPRSAGVNVWRSTDGGVSWSGLAQSATLARASLGAVIVVGNQLLAVGSQLDADQNDYGASWTSTDGESWQPAELPPSAPHLARAATGGNTVVAFGDDQDYPLAWISRDGGGHWYEESVDVAGTNPNDLTMAVEDVAPTASGYVAVGEGCCIGAAQLVPIVFTTPDGTQWQGTPLAATQAQAMRRVGRLADRLLVVGVETYVNADVVPTGIGGRSWVSADGTTWQAGPDFAELGDGDVTALAIGSGGVVLAGVTYDTSGSDPNDTGLRVWFAPYSAFGNGTSN
jgi:hypothetical protein